MAPGYGWVEGTYFCYRDASGNKRMAQGVKEGATGQTPGQPWIEDEHFRYIDAYGDERHFGTWVLGESKLGIDTVLGG